MARTHAATPVGKATEASESLRRAGRSKAAVFIGTMVILVSFGTSASAQAPLTAIGAVPAVAGTVEAPSQIPAPVCGTWVMLQANKLSALKYYRPLIDSALALPGIKGFSLRSNWSNITADLSIYDAGVQIAQADHSALAIRFIAGINTPPQFIGNGTTMSGQTIPLPWGKGSTANSFVPNTVFETAYGRTVSQLAAYARKHGMHLLHLPWYGGKSDEIYAGSEVQSEPGYSLQNFLTGYERLVAIGMSVTGTDLSVEFPLGGVGTGPFVHPLETYMSTKYGNNSPKLMVQFNDLSDVLPGQQHPSTGVNMERQMVGGGDFNWANVYQQLVTQKTQTVEVYLTSFGASLKHAALLRTEAAAFAPC